MSTAISSHKFWKTASFCTALLLNASVFVSAEDWPQWRGPNRTGISKETGLLKKWPEGGPKRVWLFENAGNAYSGPAIANGKLYTMGTRDGAECLLALDALTGQEIWVSKVGPILENGWGGGPRGTPTVDGELLFAMSGPGNLVCVQVSDGKILWQQKMTELGGRVPDWGYTESVLVDGDKVICTPGGSKGAIAALEKKTGKLLWQSKDFTDGAQYASVVPAEINGVKQYIQLTMVNLAGVSPDDGKLLWKASFPGRTAVIPTPIQKDNLVYVTAGYNAGCKMVKIEGENKATTVYENKVMKNHHGGVILVGDYLYGHSDGSRDTAGWVCQDFKTGQEVWIEKSKLGKGSIGYADGMLYLLDERGTVALIEASPKGFNEHGRFKLDPQTKIRSNRGAVWTHPVISNGKLYLRDQDLIFCFDVKG